MLSLIISVSIKIAVLFWLGIILLRKWICQERKFLTDFPLLTSLGFFILILGKFLDIYIYLNFDSLGNLEVITTEYALIVTRIRFLISPILVVLPYFILMMVIWFAERKKMQFLMSSIWVILSLISVFLAKTYTQLLLINIFVAFPVILLSIITFAFIHHRRRLPEINSQILAIGWSFYAITQIIRPLWKNIGSYPWGLSWLGEIIELLALVLIGIGFATPALYDRTPRLRRISRWMSPSTSLSSESEKTK